MNFCELHETCETFSRESFWSWSTLCREGLLRLCKLIATRRGSAKELFFKFQENVWEVPVKKFYQFYFPCESQVTLWRTVQNQFNERYFLTTFWKWYGSICISCCNVNTARFSEWTKNLLFWLLKINNNIRHFSHVTQIRIFKNPNLKEKTDRNFRRTFLKNRFRHLKLHSNPPSWLAISCCHMGTFCYPCRIGTLWHLLWYSGWHLTSNIWSVA